MAFTMQVHQRDHKDPSVIAKVKPYVRFSERGETPVFLQDGRFHSEDGKHINNPKAWALDSAENLSEKVKKEVKYEGELKKRGRPAGSKTQATEEIR